MGRHGAVATGMACDRQGKAWRHTGRALRASHGARARGRWARSIRAGRGHFKRKRQSWEFADHHRLAVHPGHRLHRFWSSVHAAWSCRHAGTFAGAHMGGVGVEEGVRCEVRLRRPSVHSVVSADDHFQIRQSGPPGGPQWDPPGRGRDVDPIWEQLVKVGMYCTGDSLPLKAPVTCSVTRASG